MAKKHNTRSNAKWVVQEQTQPFFELNSSHKFLPINIDRFDSRTQNPRPDPLNNHSQLREQAFQHTGPTVANSQSPGDVNQIGNMIENTLIRLLTNFNMIPNAGQQNTHSPTNVRFGNSQHSRQSTNNPVGYNHNSQHQSHSHRDDHFPIRTEKILPVIKNWNLKFDGSEKGLHVEEFLYRVRSLTTEHFNGDFNIICKNIPTLLTGKAINWYWRYHKKVASIEWNEFCAALMYEYKEYKES